MGQVVSILAPIPWFAWIAIIAIVCGAVTKVVAMSHRHRERMMMIQAGMHPDESPHAQAVGYGKPAADPDEI